MCVSTCEHVIMHLHVSVCMHVHMCICACMLVCACACASMCVCVNSIGAGSHAERPLASPYKVRAIDCETY